jgi:16S rRNA (guanine966-N2)-methyltransferase
MQGAEKIPPRRICAICKQEIFFSNTVVGMKYGFWEMPLNKVRIIGGDLRSRMIGFPDVSGLRPTPDRVRETLFNWLGQTLHGRCCLDLFAGSGALGFEAASRGAECVVMVEKNRTALRALQDNARKLDCANVFFLEQDGLEFASCDTRKYDLIFLDPPFQSDYLPKLLAILPQRLNENGVVYIESGAAIEVHPPWQVIKSGKAGQVRYQLLQVA